MGGTIAFRTANRAALEPLGQVRPRLYPHFVHARPLSRARPYAA
jgi:hypothetical protein